MNKDAECDFVVGRRGSGKSTLVKNLIGGEPRVIVFDPMREYGAIGFQTVETLEALRLAVAGGWDRGFRVAFVPTRHARAEAFERVCDFVLRAQRPYFDGSDHRQILLVAEELNIVFPSHGKASGSFSECILQGRHYGINIIGVTQRPALVGPTFRDNCRTWYVLPLGGNDDRQEVLRKSGKEWTEPLRVLENHNFLEIRDGVVSEGKNPPI